MCSSVSLSVSVGKLNTHYQFRNDYTSCYSVVGTCTHSMAYSDFVHIQLYMQLYYVCAVLVAMMIWCMHGLLC